MTERSVAACQCAGLYTLLAVIAPTKLGDEALRITSSASSGATETARPLVTPDELRRLGAGDQLLLVRGEDPVLARRIAYYADREFGPRANQKEA